MASSIKPIVATLENLSAVLQKRPLLWVGAGASIAAGYPSMSGLLGELRAQAEAETGDVIPDGLDLTEVVDLFIESCGGGALQERLHRKFKEPREPTPLHRAIARLATRDSFAAIVTTNYDPLITNALTDCDVPHVVDALGGNVALGTDDLRVIKVHGSYTDWSRVILSGASYEHFNRRYELLRAQLDVLLTQRPVLLVGCSMTDPRILDWLSGREGPWVRNLQPWRPMMTRSAWDRALAAPYKGAPAAEPLAASGSLRPLLIDSDDTHLFELWRSVASILAPADR